ncbi:endo-1,4-beta-xylanase [Hephaestia caeni]|uniref:Beta-xylanase n=1 Tax=Hephaestia caeni TaxID=645617 RepID=A0A397P608_9SPHN|nr:endo-1,4-beta-xylanase [Hephaestia caeni]RIA43703.1 endo-1,4-beta-xylanase [Hephaestia caeni]
MASEITRREGMALLAGCGLAGLGLIASGDGARAAAAPSIDAVARKGKRRFGSAFGWSPPGADAGSFANPAYAALLERECGVLVPENELKWQALRPDAASFAFDRVDAMLDYAMRQGMAVRGHTLLWHRPKWMPAWAESHDFGSTPATEAERLLTTHIETVMRHCGPRIASWDVVNEAVDPETGGLIEIALSRAMGGAQQSIDLAFHTARAHAPAAELVYNDFMSWGAGSATHRTGVLRLLEGFRARGVPVDTLGIQSHLVTNGPDIAATVARQESDWRAFLDAVVAMGYRLIITELDVRDTGLAAPFAVRDPLVADYTRAYLDIMLGYPQLGDVLVWGMCDKYSWLDGFDPRDDGKPRRGCCYDPDFRATPMRAAIAAAFAGRLGES